MAAVAGDSTAAVATTAHTHTATRALPRPLAQLESIIFLESSGMSAEAQIIVYRKEGAEGVSYPISALNDNGEPRLTFTIGAPPQLQARPVLLSSSR